MDIMSELMEEVENPADFQNEVNSVGTIQMEGGHTVNLQNEMASTTTTEVEGEHPVNLQNEMTSTTTTEVEGGHTVNLRNEMASTTTTEVEGENPVNFQNEGDAVRKTVVEGEHLALCQNEMDSVKIMTERLPLMLTEEIGQPVSIVPLDKLQKPTNNLVETSNTTGEKEKKVPMNKVRVGLAPPPNLKTVKAKVVTWNNRYYRSGESQMKIHSQKRDHSKIQVKVDSVKVMKERVPLMLTKETACGPASMESLVKLDRPTKIFTEASKTTDEKRKVTMNRVRGTCIQPPYLKIVKPKIDTWNKNYHGPGESQIKIYSQKLDYSNIQAKVNTWRKI